MAIHVTCSINTCDESSEDKIEVRSHFVDTKLVVIETKDSFYTVNGEDLIQAVRNAMHTNGYLGM